MTAFASDRDHHITLDVVTVVTFYDGNDTIARSYRGMGPFEHGLVISVVGRKDALPIKMGEYLLQRSDIAAQLSVAGEESSRAGLYRYFDARLLTRKD